MRTVLRTLMPRPLLDRLHDIEHALKLDNQPLHAETVREAIEELQRRERLMQAVDVQIDQPGSHFPR